LPPLTIIGVGEANMDFLNELGAYSEVFVIENVVEGVSVPDQLAMTVQKHLKNVILKDIHLRYFSGDTEIVTTQNQINFWEENHQGSTFLIAGRFLQTSLTSIEINAKSSDGEYKKTLPFQPGPLNWGCIAFAEFCTDTNFKGDCQIYNDSQKDLGVFAQKAVSANINGTCAWQVFTEAQYEGQSVTLDAPGDFEILDRFGDTSLYKTISSLKVRPQSNVARKIWAYLTIQDAIKDDQTNNSKMAYEASLEQNFLTPYTDAIFGAEEDDQTDVNMVVTYGNLVPYFFQVNDTIMDLNCTNNFHFAIAESTQSKTKNNECTGSLTLYQKAQFQGDKLEVDKSIRQVTHSTEGRSIGSYQSTGNCCWKLYYDINFTGKVKEICGDSNQRVNKNHNIGSIKLIEPQPSKESSL